MPPLLQQFCARWVWTRGRDPLVAPEAAAGPSESPGTAASVNKESAEPLGRRGGAGVRECGAEAWRGPSEPGRPPRLPLLPQLLRRPSWRLSGGSARPLDYGRDFQVAELRGWGGHREGSDPSGSSWRQQASTSGGSRRQKLPNRKTVNDKVGDVYAALSRW